MKKFFKRIAAFFVKAYARRMYRKAVDIAEKRHTEEKTMIYVISSPFNPSRLVTCNRSEFRKIKKRLGIVKHPVEQMKAGAWYHTSDAIGRGGLRPADEKARAIAFEREMLTRAKL